MPAGRRRVRLGSMETFELTSSAFADEQRIPAQYTTDGDDTPPPLAWSAPPPTTRMLVVIVEDPDAARTQRVHWIAWGMPATAGVLDATSGARHEGTNSFGLRGYRGPCPPHGDGPHRYVFRVYALDRDVALLGDADVRELVSAIHHHVVGIAELVGIYER
jgi:Raf kinase inhibitor-like YbhB/YbcL family protein